MSPAKLALWTMVLGAALSVVEPACGRAAASGLSPPSPATATPPYALADALADAQSGPLRLVGKGSWYGLSGSPACVYRNERVLVVDEYCRPHELSSFGVTIVSPSRGRATLYAEGRRPVSQLGRRDYLIFSGRSEVIDSRRPLSLQMSVEERSEYHAFAGRSVAFCDVSIRREKRGRLHQAARRAVPGLRGTEPRLHQRSARCMVHFRARPDRPAAAAPGPHD